MYSTAHFHSTSHELLCIVQGSARVCFGGERNERGERNEQRVSEGGKQRTDEKGTSENGSVVQVLSNGDAVLIPAGVSHNLLEDLGRDQDSGKQEDFLMVGSYPKGCSWDMCYGKPDEEEKVKRIKTLGWFERDPIFGDGGPACGI